MARTTNKRRGATEVSSCYSTSRNIWTNRLSSDQLYGWLPPEALTEHIERLSQQIAALMPLPRKGLDKTYRTSWQDLAVEKLDLEEHTFAEQQKAISTNRVLGENLDGNGNQIVTERQAVRHSPLIRYSTESLLKLCQSPLICWPDGLPKDKKWMGYFC